jgi:hypothetical protein
LAVEGVYGKREIVSHRTGRQSTVDAGLLGFVIGFDVYRENLLSLHPLAGLYLAVVELDVDPSDPPLFRDQILASSRGAGLMTLVGMAFLGVGVEQALPLCDTGEIMIALTVGVRLGYLHQLNNMGWSLDRGDGRSEELAGGPSADMSGALFLLCPSISLQSP